MRTTKFTDNLRCMKRFMRLAAILATLLFSMTFVMQSSAADVAAGNPTITNPMVMTVAQVASKSDSAFFRPGFDRPFFRPAFNPFFRPAFNPFFRPAFNPFFRPAFNPFFDVDVDVDPFFDDDFGVRRPFFDDDFGVNRFEEDD